MAKVLITGGSGLLGTHLSELLTQDDHEVIHLSRSVSGNETYKTFKWNVRKQEIDLLAFEGVDHIIHLAGAGVADERWTTERKRIILDSRVNSIELLYKTVKEKKVKLKSFISASAIGYYGMDTGSQIVSEDSSPGEDFLADVVKAWEVSTEAFSDLTTVAKVRIGIVLSDKGGALPTIAKPIKLMVGAPLGSGQQYMSWVHIDDVCGIFKFLMEKKATGTYNAVAPKPVTNKEMTKVIAGALGKPLILPNVPAFVMKLILGEMSNIVLGGSKISSEKISNLGYQFKYTEVEQAVNNLLKD